MIVILEEDDGTLLYLHFSLSSQEFSSSTAATNQKDTKKYRATMISFRGEPAEKNISHHIQFPSFFLLFPPAYYILTQYTHVHGLYSEVIMPAIFYFFFSDLA